MDGEAAALWQVLLLAFLRRKEDIIYFSQANILPFEKIILFKHWIHSLFLTGNRFEKIMFSKSIDSSRSSTHAQIRHNRRHIQVAKLDI